MFKSHHKKKIIPKSNLRKLLCKKYIKSSNHDDIVSANAKSSTYKKTIDNIDSELPF